MSWLDTPLQTRPMTPAEVLATFADLLRQRDGGEPIPEHDDEPRLSRDMSVRDLLALLDKEYDDWQTTGAWLERWFGIQATRDELACLLMRPKKTTVGRLCDFIAARAKVPILAEARLMGQSSWEAAIFRTIRGVLKESGADVSGLAPSSLLEPYLRRHGQAFSRDLARLFPGQMPEMLAVHIPAVSCLRALLWACWLAGWILVTLSFCGLAALQSWQTLLAAAGLIGLTYPASWVLSLIPPRAVELGALKSFRDLCSALAAHRRSGTAHLFAQPSPEPATRPALAPVFVLGRPCLEAAVFRALRDILGRDGADVSDLAPSSALEPYIRAHREALVLDAGALAPGRLPSIQEDHPLAAPRVRAILKRILYGSTPVYVVAVFAAAWALGERVIAPMCLGAIAITVLLAAGMALCDLIPPRSVRLGDCTTFADLCRVMSPTAVPESVRAIAACPNGG